MARLPSPLMGEGSGMGVTPLTDARRCARVTPTEPSHALAACAGNRPWASDCYGPTCASWD
jgi:glucokinase